MSFDDDSCSARFRLNESGRRLLKTAATLLYESMKIIFTSTHRLDLYGNKHRNSIGTYCALLSGLLSAAGDARVSPCFDGTDSAADRSTRDFSKALEAIHWPRNIRPMVIAKRSNLARPGAWSGAEAPGDTWRGLSPGTPRTGNSAITRSAIDLISAVVWFFS